MIIFDVSDNDVSQSSFNRFDEVFSFENLYNSAIKCKKGVSWKASVQNYMRAIEFNVGDTRYELIEKKFKFETCYDFWIWERGKKRHIQSIKIKDRVVQKTLCDCCLDPLFKKSFIYDNSASTKGKGLTFTVNRMVAMLEKHYRKHGTNGYVLLFDFKDYFGSIDHKTALKLISEKIKDKDLLKLIYMCLKVFTTDEQKNGVGIGLGSQVSQFIALLMANEIDHLIKDELGFKYYIRYMDDGMVICESKEKLNILLTKIEEKSKELKLTLNKKKTQIIPLSKGFTFIKKKTQILDSGKIIIKIPRASITRQRRKMKKFRGMLNNKLMTMENIESSYMSWRGYAQAYNTYKAIKKMDNLFLELFGYLPRKKDDYKRYIRKKTKKRIVRLYEMSEEMPNNYRQEDLDDLLQNN